MTVRFRLVWSCSKTTRYGQVSCFLSRECSSWILFESFRQLFDTFLDTMEATGADFTNSFRTLSLIHLPNSKDFDRSIDLFISNILDQCCDAEEWKFIHKSSVDDRYFFRKYFAKKFSGLFNRTYELLRSLAGTNNAILSQFGFSQEMLERERTKKDKVKELEVR